MIDEHLRTRLILKTAWKLKELKVRNFTEAIKAAGPAIQKFASDLNISISDEEILQISKDAVAKLTMTSDIGVSVSSARVREDRWLENSGIEFSYFKRYIKYLKIKKQWIDTTALCEDSFSIIQMLGNPESDNHHRRGMIVGDIQSGKTGSYTAVINRAIDVGYDVIVLLAGSLENLRRQTQERIDKEVIGKTLDVSGDGRTFISTGVSCFQIQEHLKVQTDTKHDYNTRQRANLDSAITKGRTLLYVAKKTVTALNTMLTALEEDNASLLDEDGKLHASILLIDDEADNASINTKKCIEMDPTKINGGIRKLLNKFISTSYLAVTATPFANIFVDDRTESEMYGDDLFPSDFIHLLDRPAAYTGAYKLFGETAMGEETGEDYSHILIPVEKKNIPSDSYAFRHKKDDVIIGSFHELPESLQKAVRYFVIVQYLMDDFMPQNSHRTMMVNVSRFVKVQNKLADSIDIWLHERLRSDLFQWHNYPERGDDPCSGELYKLKKIWEEYNLESLSGRTWSEICPGLYESVMKIRVSEENMSKQAKEKGRLNYQLYPSGDRVISVGGQCLSRGLTLENLVVTYFYRNSAAYDTLLQMGRWFGYRDSYMQYFRIWMAEESILWYRLISDATEDLRLQIGKMNSLKMEPSQFGLMVRRHPSAGLIITARNKMRNAVKGQRQPVNLDGRLIESPRLWESSILNHKNDELIRSFLASVNDYETDGQRPVNIIIRNVDKASVYTLVTEFSSATLSIGFKVSQLSDYIMENLGPLWDVAISQASKKMTEKIYPISIGGKELMIRTVEREYKGDSFENGHPYIRINDHHVKVGEGSVTKLALTEKQIDELKMRIAGGDAKKWSEVSGTATVYLEAREENSEEYRKPLLLLYPLKLRDDESNILNKDGEIIWAIGIGFPGVRGDKTQRYFEYWLNPVAVREGVGLDLDEEEGDDEIDESAED
ncbi:MAG: Z1 domain-containing protein [Treponema sp.]|nr:Z1 domain-containing protein [Treponema sp.]MDY4799594.1 Z1 domain-containing protein [Bullifex sp.]